MTTEQQKALYTAHDLHIMRLAEAARLPGKNRIVELMNYARLAGIRRIGIANCISLQKEADALKSILEQEFEVVAIDCKVGKLTTAELLDTDARGISCNPAAQAALLAEAKTELNVSVGLCMGHDMVFAGHSNSPVTTLIVKDRAHRHNPCMALSAEMQY